MKYLILQVVGFDKSAAVWPDIRLATTEQKEQAALWHRNGYGADLVLELPDNCQYRVVPKTELEIN